VTFWDSDSAPVPKFFNPGPDPANFLIWESHSCSDSGYNHRSNRNLPMFLLEKCPHRLLLLPKLKSDSGPGPFFSNFWPGSGSGSETKTQNSAGVDSGFPDPVPPLIQSSDDEWIWIWIRWIFSFFCTRGCRSHFLRLQLCSCCSKIFESGSGSGQLFQIENPTPAQTPATIDAIKVARRPWAPWNVLESAIITRYVLDSWKTSCYPWIFSGGLENSWNGLVKPKRFASVLSERSRSN